MSETPTDILIAGAGAAGLSAGIGLARRGRRVTVVGKIDRRPTGRTIALLDASMRFYEDIGLADDIARNGALLRIMRIVDDTGSLFRIPQADFDSSEIGLDAFGINIENVILIDLLLRAARQTPGLILQEGLLSDFALGLEEASARTENGELLAGSLLVAADGRQSAVRSAAGIQTHERKYPQTALTALLAHDRPHRDVSTEFHTRAGPFTLVPLCPSSADPHRSSLVWMMQPADAERLAALPSAELARRIEQQAHSMLGGMRLLGDCGLVPMATMRADRLTGERVALVGDAAH